MKSKSPQVQPAPVPIGVKQAGEVRVRWAWAEATVWTERMLTALEEGIKGGVWFSLIDKVYRSTNLHVAFAKVRANGGAAGVDHQRISAGRMRSLRSKGCLA